MQLELDRVVSLHLNSGVLDTNNCTADTAQLFGAILSFLKNQRTQTPPESRSGAPLSFDYC